MTLAEITMKKFIFDINSESIPGELAELYERIRKESIYTGQKIWTLTTIPVFRRIFNENDILQIINYYKQETEKEQLKLF